MTGTIRDVDDYTPEQRSLIGSAVEQARLDRGWTKEEAARHARMSSITWKRVEDGLRVQTLKLRSIEIALGWGGGSMDRVARGRPVVVRDEDTIEQVRARGWADHDDSAIWEGFRAATQFANDCGARGADQRLVNDFIGDAVALLNDVGRVRSHPEDSGLRSVPPTGEPEIEGVGSVGSSQEDAVEEAARRDRSGRHRPRGPREQELD